MSLPPSLTPTSTDDSTSAAPDTAPRLRKIDPHAADEAVADIEAASLAEAGTSLENVADEEPQEAAAASDNSEAEVSTAATTSAAADAGADSLPVPVGPLRNELTQPKDDGAKPSLWKRFRMRARGESSKATNNTPKLARDPQVGVRLDSIERKIDEFDATLREQLDGVHARLEEVWESEEQLSHLADIQDKLDHLAQSHSELTQGIANLRRSTYGLAVLVVLAALASGLLYSSSLF